MPVDPKRVQKLFLAAVEAPGIEARQALLQQLAGADTELLRRVQALLRAHDDPDSLLDIPFVESPATVSDTTAGPAAVHAPGIVIGPYKLLQQLGEGGMGTVYMAEQSLPVYRKVALKIIKPGMDSRQVIARFEAERQALALMDHPNIAKVLDAGTTDTGRPYFVMELVKGVSITQYCDQHQLDPERRLRLFVDVCHAVQHAHQKGIIHRDLKPSNVLVAEYDEKPAPKVIDFGVAKAVGQRLTEKTMFTAFGQILGTIEYMSPEHAKLNQLDIDTRSDVYSLGVILYELLTGQTPLDRKRLEAAALDEMLRIIREEDPVRPSTRLSNSTTLPSVAANRQLEPRKLTTLVRGELDWIVMKALEKDRTRRYETATGLAADIQRYLADEPVSAAAPSRAYKVRKFVRRNKLVVTASAVLLLALLAAIMGTTHGMVSESRRRLAAERERAATEATLARAMLGRFKYSESEALLRKVLATRLASNLPEDQQAAATTQLQLSRALLHQGRIDEAEQFARDGVAAARRAFPPNDPNIIESLRYLATFIRNQRRDFVQAEKIFREALDMSLNAVPLDHTSIGNGYLYVADALTWQHRFADSEPFYRLALAEYLHSPDPSLFSSEANMGLSFVLLKMNRFAEAENAVLQGQVRTPAMPAQLQLAGLTAAIYHFWDKAEPGRGHAAKVDEWMGNVVATWFLSGVPTSQPAN